MIFKSWTTPIKADVWAKYASYSTVLLLLAFSGNIISGYTEYKAANSFWEGVGIVLLLEGGAWIASMMFFTNFFSLIKSSGKDVASWIYTAIGGVLLFFIIMTSFNMSSIGKNVVVEDQTPPPAIVQLDDRKANSLQNKALEQFKGDSLETVAIAMIQKDSVKAVLSAIIRDQSNKKARIMSYADYEYTKYKTSISRIESTKKAANKRLKALNSEYKTLLNNRLDMKRSKQMKSLAFSSSVRTSTISATDSLNEAKTAAYLADLEYKKTMLEYVIYLGICFTMLYVFTYNLSRYLSGSEPIYKNPFEGVISPIERAMYGLRLRLRYGGDYIADRIAPKETIQVMNKGFVFNVKAGQAVTVNSSTPTPPLQNANNSITAPKPQPIAAPVPVEPLQPAPEPLPIAAPTSEPIQTPVIQGFKMEVQPMPATSLMPEVARNPIILPAEPIQSVNPTLRERRIEGIKAMKEVQRTVIQGFVFEDETKDETNYEGMETVNDTAESVEAFEDMLKVFNYNKYRTQLMSNFTRMCQTKVGEKKKTKNWVEVANNRLEKVRTLSQLFVKQGYKVTHKITDGKYEIELDEVENPSLIGIAPDERKVNIYYAPNDYKLPIFFQYDFDTKS